MQKQKAGQCILPPLDLPEGTDPADPGFCPRHLSCSTDLLPVSCSHRQLCDHLETNMLQKQWEETQLHCHDPYLQEGFPAGSAGEESSCNAGDPGVIPRGGRSAGKGRGYPLQHSSASLVVQLVKNPPRNAGDPGSIPGWGRSPGEGKGYPLQYPGLRNFMDCTVRAVAKSRTRLSNSHFLFFKKTG